MQHWHIEAFQQRQERLIDNDLQQLPRRRDPRRNAADLFRVICNRGQHFRQAENGTDIIIGIMCKTFGIGDNAVKVSVLLRIFSSHVSFIRIKMG